MSQQAAEAEAASDYGTPAAAEEQEPGTGTDTPAAERPHSPQANTSPSAAPSGPAARYSLSSADSRSSGLRPRQSGTLRLALAASRAAAMRSWPPCSARCSGDQPLSLSRASGSAPASSSASTSPAWFLHTCQAKRGVQLSGLPGATDPCPLRGNPPDGPGRDARGAGRCSRQSNASVSHSPPSPARSHRRHQACRCGEGRPAFKRQQPPPASSGGGRWLARRPTAALAGTQASLVQFLPHVGRLQQRQQHLGALAVPDGRQQAICHPQTALAGMPGGLGAV